MEKKNHKLWFFLFGTITFFGIITFLFGIFLNHSFLVASAASYGSYFGTITLFWNHNFWVGTVRSYDSFVWKARAIDRILTRHKSVDVRQIHTLDVWIVVGSARLASLFILNLVAA